MVVQYDINGNVLREFRNAIEFERNFVTFDNGGYVGKIYADTESGEYFDDPDNPLPPPPPEPEPGNPDVDQLLDYIENVGGVDDGLDS